MDIKDYTGYTIELEDSDRGCKIMSYKIYKEGKEKAISFKEQKNGYKSWVVYLTNNVGVQKGLCVARLIMQHFKPDEWDEKLQADHIDFNSLNNSIDNLRMLTQKENKQNKSSKPRSDNKSSEHKNIHQDGNTWRFRKMLNGLEYRKNFKTLDVAVEFKKMFLIIHNCS